MADESKHEKFHPLPATVNLVTGRPIRLTVEWWAHIIRAFLNLAPAVRHSPNGRLQASYDEDGDVLYVHFGDPRSATDSEITDDDIILRYDGDEIIGITILHTSRR